LDTSLIVLGTLIAISLASALMWHAIVKSYALAIVASALTVGLLTYFVYPIYRGVAPSWLILSDATILGAIIAVGVGFALKRWRVGNESANNDV
jgi:antibiotic biosynthesis monooxygenase (ABM) superfamily enzyme